MPGANGKANGNKAGLCCVVALLGFAFLVASLVNAVIAAQDHRSDLVAEYNKAVVFWRDGGGFEEWEESATSAVSMLSIQGLAQNKSASSLQVVRATDGLSARLLVVPRAADEYVDDLESYSKGLALVSETTQAHRSSAPTGNQFVVELNNSSSFTVAAFDCTQRRNIVERCTTTNGQENCRDEEVVSAERRWLKGLRLLAPVTEEADPCPFEWRSVSRRWNTPMNSATAGDTSAEEAAAALCLNSRPSSDISLTVTVRSRMDPYVVAGRLTSCSHDFGPTAAELWDRATLYAWVGLVCIAPSVLLCVVLGTQWFVGRLCQLREAGQPSGRVL
mmetsp:Transcript_25358/g.64421  ORF Transcript_25358/g.64421 Transcript_25358/m.64421 type:complete len:333 (-) Transcript_25358:300-1298(-)